MTLRIDCRDGPDRDCLGGLRSCSWELGDWEVRWEKQVRVNSRSCSRSCKCSLRQKGEQAHADQEGAHLYKVLRRTKSTNDKSCLGLTSRIQTKRTCKDEKQKI